MRGYCRAHVDYTSGCADCQAASRRLQAARRAGKADGTWRSWLVDGQELERVRVHVRELLKVPGVTAEQINEAAGVYRHAVTTLMVGRRKLSRAVVDALLGVTAARCAPRMTPTTLVDIRGTSRRLQALAVDGWRAEDIAELMGLMSSVVTRHRRASHAQITWELRERYRLLYEKIQAQADPRGSSPIAGQRAVRAGWLGPERWAEEDIDNPDAEPLPPPPETDDWAEVSRMIDGALRDPSPGKAREYPRHIKREIARQATTRLGWSYARVAELLGLGGPDGAGGTSAVEYLLYGRKDRPQTKELWKSGK
jgi:hypothetical protein